jgi:predicted phosphodiesterase
VHTIAIISDIHANVVALDAVMRDLERIEPDHVVCLGDVAATGPTPREVIARLRDRDWSFVRGNCDDNILRYATGDESPIVDEHDEVDRWCATCLSPEDLEFVASFRPFVSHSAGEIGLCLYHGSPRSNMDQILPDTPKDDLDRWYRGQQASVFAGGHTHIQMLRRYHEGFAINPGSVGLPFTYTADGRQVNPSWAEYGIVRVDGPNVAIELRRSPVDKNKITAVAAESGMPHRTWWSSGWE